MTMRADGATGPQRTPPRQPATGGDASPNPPRTQDTGEWRKTKIAGRVVAGLEALNTIRHLFTKTSGWGRTILHGLITAGLAWLTWPKSEAASTSEGQN